MNFAGEKNPQRTLKAVLDDLSRRYNFPYTIIQKAFKYEMLDNVEKTEIAKTNPIPPMRTTLGKVIGRVLEHVPVPSGATFLAARGRHRNHDEHVRGG